MHGLVGEKPAAAVSSMQRPAEGCVRSLQHERINQLCKQLKFIHLANKWPALAKDAARDRLSFASFLEAVLTSEQAAREARRHEMLMRFAKMPSIKTLDQFDWARVGWKLKVHIVELGNLGFVERAENVFMLGASGLGKTHIALALCRRAVMAGHKARFITAADLMTELAAAKAQNRLEEYSNRMVLAPKLLVIDEIGDLPSGQEETNVFFNVVAERCERGSTVLTSNLPLTQWADAFANDQTLTTATLDRLLHRAHIVKMTGKSSRLKAKRKVSETARKATSQA